MARSERVDRCTIAARRSVRHDSTDTGAVPAREGGRRHCRRASLAGLIRGFALDLSIAHGVSCRRRQTVTCRSWCYRYPSHDTSRNSTKHTITKRSDSTSVNCASRTSRSAAGRAQGPKMVPGPFFGTGGPRSLRRSWEGFQGVPEGHGFHHTKFQPNPWPGDPVQAKFTVFPAPQLVVGRFEFC